ncbi:MAG: hypothetical protein JO297_15250 [Nitrososphaeraceae archaeon]|nr:hypothetical protein [Nitrososphaeraceae archaeon]
MTLSIYEYVGDEDILRAYRTLGFDPCYRIKCNKCNLLGDRYHLYRLIEHMNDYHRASFKEIGSDIETSGTLSVNKNQIKSRAIVETE